MSDPSRAFSSEQGNSTASRLSARTQTHADISHVELAKQSTYHLTVEDAKQICTVMANKTHNCFRNQLKMQIWALWALTVRFHSWAAHWIFSLSQGFQGKGDDEMDVRKFFTPWNLTGFFYLSVVEVFVPIYFASCTSSFHKTWRVLHYCLCWTLNWSCTNWYKESLNKIMWYWYRLSYSWWDYYSLPFMPSNTV